MGNNVLNLVFFLRDTIISIVLFINYFGLLLSCLVFLVKKIYFQIETDGKCFSEQIFKIVITNGRQ